MKISFSKVEVKIDLREMAKKIFFQEFNIVRWNNNIVHNVHWLSFPEKKIYMF